MYNENMKKAFDYLKSKDRIDSLSNNPKKLNYQAIGDFNKYENYKRSKFEFVQYKSPEKGK
ncbi:MAG: hypothetical protein KatS3mg068_1539 [Candidatus Sericytochromatia bacterium]|nr:MAG: hypothetical protein KatS3mg068_1539 [Candidatus Sericytochromatia bacterium]